MDRDPTQAAPVSAGGDPQPHPLAVPFGLGLTAVFVVLDQATKELAERLLQAGQFVPLLGEHIGWELVYNPGGAFGVPAPSWVFVVVTVLVAALVLRVLPRTSSLLAASAYGLLLAGALGNIIDRILRPGGPDRGFADGWVVDFVAWGTFPRFNVADSAITVGFVALVLALFREERQHAHRARDVTGDDNAPPRDDGCGSGDDGRQDGDDPGPGQDPGPTGPRPLDL